MEMFEINNEIIKLIKNHLHVCYNHLGKVTHAQSCIDIFKRQRYQFVSILLQNTFY